MSATEENNQEGSCGFCWTGKAHTVTKVGLPICLDCAKAAPCLVLDDRGKSEDEILVELMLMTLDGQA